MGKTNEPNGDLDFELESLDKLLKEFDNKAGAKDGSAPEVELISDADLDADLKAALDNELANLLKLIRPDNQEPTQQQAPETIIENAKQETPVQVEQPKSEFEILLSQITSKGLLEILSKNEEELKKLLKETYYQHTIYTQAEIDEKINNLSEKLKTIKEVIEAKFKNKQLDIIKLNQIGANELTPAQMLQIFNNVNKTSYPDSFAAELYSSDIQSGGEHIYEYELSEATKALTDLLNVPAEATKEVAKFIFDTNARERVKNALTQIKNKDLQDFLLKQNLLTLDKVKLDEKWVGEVNDILTGAETTYKNLVEQRERVFQLSLDDKIREYITENHKEPDENTKNEFAKKLQLLQDAELIIIKGSIIKELEDKLNDKLNATNIKVDLSNLMLPSERIAELMIDINKIKSYFSKQKDATSISDLKGNLFFSASGKSLVKIETELKTLNNRLASLKPFITEKDLKKIQINIDEIAQFLTKVKEKIFANIPKLLTQLQEALATNNYDEINFCQRELNLVLQPTTLDTIQQLTGKNYKPLIEEYTKLVSDKIIPWAVNPNYFPETPTNKEAFETLLNQLDGMINSGEISLKVLDELIANSSHIITENPELGKKIEILMDKMNAKIAAAIFTRDEQLFLKLNLDELFRPENYGNQLVCPGLVKISRNTETLRTIVLTELLDSASNPNQFSLTLAHWIEIAYKLYTYKGSAKDFTAIHTIFSTITNTIDVARLIYSGDINNKIPNAIFKSLPKHVLEHFEELAKIPTEHSAPYVIYMDEQAKKVVTIIPHLTAYQASITFSKAPEKTELGQTILEKFSKMQGNLVENYPLDTTGTLYRWFTTTLARREGINESILDKKLAENSQAILPREALVAQPNIWACFTGPLAVKHVELMNILGQLTENNKVLLINGNLSVVPRKKSVIGLTGISDRTRDAFNYFLDYIAQTIKAGTPDFELFDKLISSPWGQEVLAVNFAKSSYKTNKELVDRVRDINQQLINSFVANVNNKCIDLMSKITEKELSDLKNHTNKEICPNIFSLFELGSNISRYFSEIILKETNHELIALNIDRLFKCLYQNYLNKNYFIMNTLMTVVCSTPLNKLLMQEGEPTIIFTALSDEAKQHYNFFKDYAEPKLLRRLTSQGVGAAIPDFSLLTGDLDRIKNGAGLDLKKDETYQRMVREFIEQQNMVKSLAEQGNFKVTSLDRIERAHLEIGSKEAFELAAKITKELKNEEAEISSSLKYIIKDDSDKKLALLNNVVLRDYILYTIVDRKSITDKHIKELNSCSELEFSSPEQGKEALKALLSEVLKDLSTNTPLKLPDESIQAIYIEMERLHANSIWSNINKGKQQLIEQKAQLTEENPAYSAIDKVIKTIDAFAPGNLNIASLNQSHDLVNNIKAARSVERVDYLMQQHRKYQEKVMGSLADACTILENNKATKYLTKSDNLFNYFDQYVKSINDYLHEIEVAAKGPSELKRKELEKSSEETTATHRTNLTYLRNSVLQQFLQENPAASNGYLVGEAEEMVAIFNDLLWDERYSSKSNYAGDKDYLTAILTALKIDLTPEQIDKISQENTRLRKLIDEIDSPVLIATLKDGKHAITLGNSFDKTLIDNLTGKIALDSTKLNDLLKNANLENISDHDKHKIILAANKKYFMDLHSYSHDKLEKITYKDFEQTQQQLLSKESEFIHIYPAIKATLEEVSEEDKKANQEFFDTLFAESKDLRSKLAHRKEVLEFARLIKHEKLFKFLINNDSGISIPSLDNKSEQEQREFNTKLKNLANDLNAFIELNHIDISSNRPYSDAKIMAASMLSDMKLRDIDKLLEQADIKIDNEALHSILLESASTTYKELPIEKYLINKLTILKEKTTELFAQNWQPILLSDKAIEQQAANEVNKEIDPEKYNQLVSKARTVKMKLRQNILMLLFEYTKVIDELVAAYKKTRGEDTGWDVFTTILTKLIAATNPDTTFFDALKTLERFILDTPQLFSNEIVSNLIAMSELGATQHRLHQMAEYFLPIYQIQAFANDSHQKISSPAPDSFTNTVTRLIQKEATLNSSERAEYMQEILNANLAILHLAVNIQDKIDQAKIKKQKILSDDLRVDIHEETPVIILEKSIESLEEQKAVLWEQYNILNALYDRQIKPLLESKAANIDLKQLSEEQATKLLEHGAMILCGNITAAALKTKSKYTKPFPIDPNRSAFSVLQAYSRVLRDENGEKLEQREDNCIKTVHAYFNESPDSPEKTKLAFINNILDRINLLADININAAQKLKTCQDPVFEIVPIYEILISMYNGLINILEKENPLKEKNPNPIIPDTTLQAIIALYENRVKTLKAEVKKFTLPIQVELEHREASTKAEQNYYAQEITAVVNSALNDDDAKWKKDPSLAKYDINVFTLQNTGKNDSFPVGTNGDIEVSDLSHAKAYNDVRTEDFINRAKLCLDATIELINARFQKHPAERARLLAFVLKLREQVISQIKDECDISHTEIIDIQDDIENAYKNAKEIYRQLLIDLSDSISKTYNKVDSKTPVNRHQITDEIKKHERLYLAKIGRPDIYHVGYKIPSSAKPTENAPYEKVVDQIDVQQTCGERTVPSHTRNIAGPFNFVREVQAHRIRKEDNSTETVVDFMGYRGAEIPFEVKDDLLRIAGGEYSASEMLKTMILDKLKVDKNLLQNNSKNNPLEISISSMTLLTALVGDEIRGKTAEARMVEESVQAWRMLINREQPFKIKIKDEIKEIHINFDVIEMNMLVKPIRSLAISKAETDLNERGFYQFTQHTEKFLNNYLTENDLADIPPEFKSELTEIKRLHTEIQSVYADAAAMKDSALAKAQKHLTDLHEKYDDALRGHYEKLNKNMDSFVRILKLSNLADITDQELKKAIIKYQNKYADLIDHLSPTDGPVNPSELKNYVKNYETELAAIKNLESQFDSAYGKINQAQEEIWRNLRNESKQLAEKSANLTQKLSAVRSTSAIDKVKKYCDITQQYTECQQLFYLRTSNTHRRKYTTKKNWYEFQTRFMTISQQTGRIVKFKCKSVEDRTGKLAELIKAFKMFKQDYGRYPIYGNKADRNLILNTYLPPIQLQSVSRKNTHLNSWGSRGKQATGTKRENWMGHLDKGIFPSIKPIKFVSSVIKYIEFALAPGKDTYVDDNQLTKSLDKAKQIVLWACENCSPEILQQFFSVYSGGLTDKLDATQEPDGLSRSEATQFNILKNTMLTISQQLISEAQLETLKLQLKDDESYNRLITDRVEPLNKAARVAELVSLINAPTIKAILLASEFVPEKNANINTITETLNKPADDITLDDIEGLTVLLPEKTAQAIFNETKRLKAIKSTCKDMPILAEILLPQTQAELTETGVNGVIEQLKSGHAKLTAINSSLNVMHLNSLTIKQYNAIRQSLTEQHLATLSVDRAWISTFTEERLHTYIKEVKPLSRYAFPPLQKLQDSEKLEGNIKAFKGLLNKMVEASASEDFAKYISLKEVPDINKYKEYATAAKAFNELERLTNNAYKYIINEMNLLAAALKNTKHSKNYIDTWNKISDFINAIVAIQDNIQLDIAGKEELRKVSEQVSAIYISAKSAMSASDIGMEPDAVEMQVIQKANSVSAKPTVEKQEIPSTHSNLDILTITQLPDTQPTAKSTFVANTIIGAWKQWLNTHADDFNDNTKNVTLQKEDKKRLHIITSTAKVSKVSENIICLEHGKKATETAKAGKLYVDLDELKPKLVYKLNQDAGASSSNQLEKHTKDDIKDMVEQALGLKTNRLEVKIPSSDTGKYAEIAQLFRKALAAKTDRPIQIIEISANGKITEHNIQPHKNKFSLSKKQPNENEVDNETNSNASEGSKPIPKPIKSSGAR